MMNEEVMRSKPTSEPMTLEQLRDMIDKPAYLYIYDTAMDSGWHIIKDITKDKVIFRGWNTVYVPISSLGKCFDLYAYPPAHIDREAWTGEWTVDEFGHKCSKCGEYLADEEFSTKTQFCHNCGRAMTEEAWSELEKRLRG